MDIRAIDARGTAWEQEHDRYRVCFRDRSAVTAHEHEVLEGVDVDDLLTWGSVYAASPPPMETPPASFGLPAYRVIHSSTRSAFVRGAQSGVL
jgi:hypothetical protein